MNIIITLPINLIEKIEDGEKTIELRKNCPSNFHPQKDVVYICEKGKKNVVGYMVVSHIVHATNWLKTWEDFGSDIGVPFDWYFEYAADAEKLYLYFIEKFVRFDRPLGLLPYFLKCTPPQSYTYTSVKYFDEEDR